jgi:hypothetical protein
MLTKNIAETWGIWSFYLELHWVWLHFVGEEFAKVLAEEGSLRVVWWLLFLTWVVPQTMEKLASVSVEVEDTTKEGVLAGVTWLYGDAILSY